MEAKDTWAAAQKLVEAHRDRNDKIKKQLELLALVDENEEEDLMSVVSNDPASLFYLAVAILSDRDPVDRIHVGGQEASTEEQAGKAERGLAGFWTQRDRDALADGNDVWNREMAFWNCFGTFYASYWLDKRDDGTPKPIADVLSPLETYDLPGMDGYGPLAVCHTYKVSVGEARDHIRAAKGDEIALKLYRDTDKVEVRDYWYREGTVVTYSLMVGGTGSRHDYAVPPTIMEGYTRIKVLCGEVAGRPRRGFPAYQRGKGILPGQGILDQNVPIYAFINKMLTSYARIARMYQRAPIVAKGLGFNPTEEDLNRDEKFDIYGALLQTTNPQASLERMDMGRSPIELRDLLDVADRLTERGGLSRALYGVLDASPSGFAISKILTSASHKLTPYVRRINFAREVISEDWLTEYRDGTFAPALVQSVNKGMRSGQAEEFKPADVPTQFFVRSEQPLSLPSDMAEKVNIARMAYPTGAVMSRRGMQENILTGIIEDPALDRKWSADDLVDAHPLTQAVKIITRMRIAQEEFKTGGQTEAARLLGAAVKVLYDNLASQLGIPGGAAPPTQAPTNQTMPNEMEAQGRSNDLVRAFTNIGPENQGR